MIKKISDQDKKDWKKFVNSNEKLENKDINISKKEKKLITRSIDLHGYNLDNANQIITNFIKNCYNENINEIRVITGKGNRSKNKSDPYLSTDLSILKYSVPDFIKNNNELMKKIKLLDLDSINNPNQGSFNIFLKKKL